MSRIELEMLRSQLDIEPGNLDLIDKYLNMQDKMGIPKSTELISKSYDDTPAHKYIQYIDTINKIRYIEIQSRHGRCRPPLSDSLQLLVKSGDLSLDHAISILENSKFKEPLAAFFLCKVCGADRVWAERFITNCENETKYLSACFMARDCGSTVEWAMSFIEQIETNGDNGILAAYYMIEYLNVDPRWAERLIKISTAKYKGFVAYQLAFLNKDSQEWAKQIIENEDDLTSAHYMIVADLADREWAERIIERSSNAFMAEFAVRMCKEHGSSKTWARKIIKKAEDLGLCKRGYWIV